MSPSDHTTPSLTDAETAPGDSENSELHWQRAYNDLVHRMGLSVAPGPEFGQDRREHPRVAFRAAERSSSTATRASTGFTICPRVGFPSSPTMKSAPARALF
jgi:hypothetical protein